MKKISLILLLFTFQMLNAQPPSEIPAVEAQIEKVTVFFQGAEVKRKTTLNIQSGKHAYVIKNLSPYLVENSIQVGGEGDYTLLSVKYRNNYFAVNDNRQAKERLQMRMDSVSAKINTENIYLEVLKSNETLLEDLQKVRNNEKVVSSAEIAEALNFREKELMSLKMKKSQTETKRNLLQNEYNKFVQEMASLNGGIRVHTGEAILTISATHSMSVPLELSYFVKEASWTPFYDFRVKNTSSPLNVIYKANVRQNTGEDWKEVKLVLSSGNPQQNNVMPNLQKWYLARYTSPPMLMLDSISDKESEDLGSNDESTETIEEKVREQDRKVQTRRQDLVITKIDGATVFNYDIEIPYTILADGSEQLVEIKNAEIPAEYQYYAAPKLDKSAYLVAFITNWEKYDLLEGKINLFLEGMFLGSSKLNLNGVNDTLKVSLGQDKRVIVDYTPLHQFNKKKLLSNQQIASRANQISVRNTRNQPISILIEDNFPTSTQKEIEVIQEDNSGGKVDADNKVKWNLNLKANEEKKLVLKYSVKYPNGWELNSNL